MRRIILVTLILLISITTSSAHPPPIPTEVREDGTVISTTPALIIDCQSNITCEENNGVTEINTTDTGGATAWDDITDPDNNADKAITFNNATETTSFVATSNFGDVDIVQIQQVTGNPTDGTLLSLTTADSDVDTLTAGDDTNETIISSTGAIRQTGSATLTLQDGSDLIITANDDAGPFLSSTQDDSTSGKITTVGLTSSADIDITGNSALTITPSGGTAVGLHAENNTAYLKHGSNIVLQLEPNSAIRWNNLATGSIGCLEIDELGIMSVTSAACGSGGSGSGDLLADGSVPMTANWDIGNFDITLKSLTGDGTIEGATLTEGGNAVFNSTETPGGELEGTWGTPTLDNTGITLTSITIGALLGVDSIDATGAVDMDYGSADVTDHTFISDNGTNVVLDGTASTIGTSAIIHNDAMDASSELLAIMDDETGTGALVFGTSPTIATPTLTLLDANGAAPTTDGEIKYNRTSERLEVGDGSTTSEFVKVGTLTDTKACTWDATGKEIDCDSAGGSDTNSPKLYYWPAAATLPLQPIADLATGAEDGVAPLIKDTDTNEEILVVAFDGTADEFRQITFQIPSDVAVGSAVTITFKGYAATAAAQDVALIFAHYCVADTEDWDGNMTEEALTTTLTNTQDALDDITKSDETGTDLGWAANDHCFAYIGRDGDHITDDGLSGDFNLISVSIEIPRS